MIQILGLKDAILVYSMSIKEYYLNHQHQLSLFNGGHILKLQYQLHWGHPPGQVVLDEIEMVSQEELQIYHCQG